MLIPVVIQTWGAWVPIHWASRSSRSPDAAWVTTDCGTLSAYCHSMAMLGFLAFHSGVILLFDSSIDADGSKKRSVTFSCVGALPDPLEPPGGAPHAAPSATAAPASPPSTVRRVETPAVFMATVLLSYLVGSKFKVEMALGCFEPSTLNSAF